MSLLCSTTLRGATTLFTSTAISICIVYSLLGRNEQDSDRYIMYIISILVASIGIVITSGRICEYPRIAYSLAVLMLIYVIYNYKILVFGSRLVLRS